MSKVEMLCWAILAVQVLIVCIGGFIADKVHQTWRIATKAEFTANVYDDTIQAQGRFNASLRELDKAVDRKFGPPLDYHDKPPGI